MRLSYVKLLADVDHLLSERAIVLDKAHNYQPGIGDPLEIFMVERLDLIIHILAVMTGKDKPSALYLLEVLQDRLMSIPPTRRSQGN